VARFQALTNFGAGVERLFTFLELLESMVTEKPKEPATVDQSTIPAALNKIETTVSEQLSLKNITLQTPDYQRTLIQNLSVQLSPGEGLLVRGPSGCGKSSLLRSIVGLWDAGSGTIARPPLEQMLFLPQRPYMVLGTLRDQLLYPKVEMQVTDEQLSEILIKVNLPDLEQRHGGFNIEKNWGEVLSLGEQQRLIFARLLLNKPGYAILDEATSALDPYNEQQLYQQLQKSGITFLSVGHRESLSDYHHAILNFNTDSTWHLKSR
jgi:vitamin B12/bleomycin/antimicrobial peptide transport system ATP-binding/permease protein